MAAMDKPTNPNDDMSGDAVIEMTNEDGRADIREAFFKGCYTSPEQVFQHDFAPGESVVKECEVAVKVPGLKCAEICLCIMTLGLYYLFVIKWGCCVPVKLFSTRAKACLTSHGRLLVWHSNISGTRTKGVGAETELSIESDIACFSIRQLCHIEKSFLREKRWCGFCPSRNDATIRCFFNHYPDNDELAAKQVFPFPRTVQMVDFGTTGSYHPLFGFKRIMGNIGVAGMMNPQTYSVSPGAKAVSDIFAGISGVGQLFAGLFGGLLTQVRANAAAAVAGWGENHVVELVSPYNDGLKKNGSAWDSFFELEQQILRLAGSQLRDHLTGQAGNSNNWRIQDTPDIGEIVDGSKVVISPQNLGLAQGEEIMDAFPMYFKWTCSDILWTILTFSIYYFLVVRKKLAMQGALVLTRKRLVEVFVYSLSGRTDPHSDSTDPFTVSYRQYFFGKLTQGFIEFSQSIMYGHFKTQFGGLLIMPMNDEVNPCVACYYGMRPEVREHVRQFLLNFAANDSPKVLKPMKNQAVNADSTVYKRAKMANEEHPIHILTSDHDFGFDFNCMRTCSCGRNPVAIEHELMITTHRIWASAEASNNPWFCQPFFAPRMDTLFWKPLVDLKASRVEGKAYYQGNCWTKCFLTKCCCFPLQSSVEVEIGSDDNFPVQIARIRTRDQYGPVARDDISKTRSLLASAMLAANNFHGVGGAPAGGAPPPAY